VIAESRPGGWGAGCGLEEAWTEMSGREAREHRVRLVQRKFILSSMKQRSLVGSEIIWLAQHPPKDYYG